MIIDHIYKSAGIQAVMRPEKFFGFPGSFMCISKRVNGPVQGDPFLNTRGIVKLFFPFYKIADKVANQYVRVIKRKICMGEVVDKPAGLSDCRDEITN